MITYVSFDEDGGEIIGWETATEYDPPPSPHLHYLCLGFLSFNPDPSCEKIVNKTVTNKTPEEITAAKLPTLHKIESLIVSELSGTDEYMPHDRPLSVEDRLEWTKYRQSLRDLSKLETPIAMLKSWPVRPDGNDAAASLRDQ
jgi:hypothetical protein